MFLLFLFGRFCVGIAGRGAFRELAKERFYSNFQSKHKYLFNHNCFYEVLRPT